MSCYLFASTLALCSWLAVAGQAAKQEEAPNTLPVRVCAIEEMAFIPEVDSWERCKPDAYPEATAAAGKAWPEEARRVGPYVTPELARQLSRWAKPQMLGYSKVPPLEKVELKPVSEYSKQRKLVLLGKLDTLPVHAPLVTRWLEVYVLYDVASNSIDRVTLTIRGERQE